MNELVEQLLHKDRLKGKYKKCKDRGRESIDHRMDRNEMSNKTVWSIILILFFYALFTPNHNLVIWLQEN